MRADQAKTIPVDRYLELQGFKPVKSRLNGRELWYHSPLRSGDNSPSFKVDTIINRWYDHGIGKGGNTLDLAVELCCSSVREALRHLEKTGLYSRQFQGHTQPTHISEVIAHRLPIDDRGQSSSLKLLHQGPVKHPALLQYLSKRRISPHLVKKYLYQIHFTPADKSKKYFGIGWPSGSGFEARNSLFKGFVGVGKDITYLKSPNTSVCAVFEGFFDFLAYMSFHNLSELPFSVITLNSGSLKSRALEKILSEGFENLLLFLDNDEAGDEGTTYFQKSLNLHTVEDQRDQYHGFKDFNERVMSDDAGFSFSQ